MATLAKLPPITPERLAADPQEALAALPRWVHKIEFVTPETGPEALPTAKAAASWSTKGRPTTPAAPSLWHDHRTVWAAMKYDSVDEEFASNQNYARRVVTFTMRFTSDLTAVDRLRCNGVEYDIKGIREIGFREAIEVKAEATDPGGV